MKKNVLLTWIAIAMMILSTGCSNQEEKVKNVAPMRVQSEIVHRLRMFIQRVISVWWKKNWPYP